MQGSRSEGERAASPVIGVVLIVAITVVVAALVAAGVFDLPLPRDDSVVPQATFTTEYDDANGLLTIQKQSGDTLERSTLTYVSQSDGELAACGSTPCVDTDWPAEVQTGDTLVLRVASDDTVRIVWESPAQNADTTAVVFRWTAGSQGE